jgi:hypothetical protein
MNNGKQKHTPGPWKHGGPTILSGGAWNLVVAILPTTIDPRPTADAAAHTIKERDANARLIAAAPDLLNMLQRMFDETAGGGEPCLLTLEQARAAIANAKGEG